MLGTPLRKVSYVLVFPLSGCFHGPISILKMLFFRPGGVRAAAILTSRKGFRGGPLLDFHGTMQLLFSSHLRERDKMLLRSILCGWAWNGFLLGKNPKRKMFPAGSVGVSMGIVISFGIALFPLLCRLESILSSFPS